MEPPCRYWALEFKKRVGKKAGLFDEMLPKKNIGS